MAGSSCDSSRSSTREAEPGAATLLAAHDLAAALKTDLASGLTAKEAARHLSHDGPNELRAAAIAPAWRRALAQLQDPLVYLTKAGTPGSRTTTK
jgi:P-type Ca2+ transporter type 2C